MIFKIENLSYQIFLYSNCQCWALVTLLAPPRHWRRQKKVAHIIVARRLNKMARWQLHEEKKALILAIAALF